MIKKNIIESDGFPSIPKKSGWPWEKNIEIITSIRNSHNALPKISIITPSFNQGKYIEETIRSVLLQGYPNLEYIIIDGGSTDNSVEIIRKYQKWIKYWVSEKDEGQSHAINKGAKCATGELMGWLNSDDILLPNCLYNVATAYGCEPHSLAFAGICQKYYLETGALQDAIPRKLTSREIANWGTDGFLYQPACFFKRSTFNEIGGLDNKLNYTMDVDLWLRISKLGKFHIINERIAQAKIYPGIKTLSNIPHRELEKCVIAFNYGYVDIAQKRLGGIINREISILTFKDLIVLIKSRLRRVIKKALK